MTENHKYNTPNKGTTDWHLPLNENFSELDADIEVRDTKANLQDYAPKSGAKFHATDTGEIFLGNGTSWEHHGVMPHSSLGNQSTFNIASAYDDATDGIMAAMNDAPDGTPVTVYIPAGQGSGPNGEYVVDATAPLSDFYHGGYGRDNVGVKVDRSNVWFVSNGATVTGASGAATNVFLPASYADTLERVAGPQISNVHFRGLVFDGKGRDNIPISFYECTNCSMTQCRFRNWKPTRDTHFDNIPVRGQHHADRLTFRKNTFRVDTDTKATFKLDGSFGSRVVDNWFYVPEGRSSDVGRLLMQNVNNDFNRAAVGNTYANNLFDTRGVTDDTVATGIAIQAGWGTRIVDNTFLSPYDSEGHALRFSTRSGDIQELLGNGLHIEGNFFHHWSISFNNIKSDTPIRGARIKDNTFVKTRDERLSRAITVGSGPIRDSIIQSNYFHNETTDVPANDNQGQFLVVSVGDFEGNTIKDNKTYNIRDWLVDNSDGAFDASTNTWENNESFDVPASGTRPPKSKNGGTATFSADGTTTDVTVTHGLAGTPTRISVEPDLDSEAVGIRGVKNRNETTFDVEFESAPDAGTDNVTIIWTAEVSSKDN